MLINKLNELSENILRKIVKNRKNAQSFVMFDLKTFQREEQKRKRTKYIYIVMAHFNKISNQMLTGSSTAMKAELMKVAKNFFKSGKTFDFIETKENGKDCLLAVMTWGSNYFNAGTQTVCVGTDKGSKIEKMWEDCVGQAQREYLTRQINKGRLHTNYIQANTMQEAWWQVCQVLLGKGTFSANN